MAWRGPEAGGRSRTAPAASVAVPALVLAVVAAGVLVGPLLAPDPLATALGEARLRPGAPGHALGTDQLGRDLLARALVGGRNSLGVAAAAVAIGLAGGGLMGMLAGLRGGLLDAVVLSATQVVLSVPGLVLALAVVGLTGGSRGSLVLGLVVLTVPAYVRLARAATLRLREEEFVLGARALGGGDRHLLTGHVLPNVAPGLLTFALLAVGTVVSIEATISFLGLGIRPPEPSWGTMIAEGVGELRSAPHLLLVPGAFLVTTVTALNVLGDAVRQRLSRGARVLPRMEALRVAGALWAGQGDRVEPEHPVGVGRDARDAAVVEPEEDE